MKKLFPALLIVFSVVFSLFAEDADWFAKKLPEKLIKSNKKTVPTAAALKNKIVLLYFSASWCGPCRSFTPQLEKFYKSVAKKENIEIILVTSDKTKDAMMKYMKKMPWLAIPFGNPQIAKLKSEFKVSGIPSLIVLDSSGKLITPNGRKDVVSLGVNAVNVWKTSDSTQTQQITEAEVNTSDKKTKKSKTKKSKKSKKNND